MYNPQLHHQTYSPQRPMRLDFPMDRVYMVNLEDLGFGLMNLNTAVGEYHARAGSTTMMDFSRGDPLANTKVNDMHKDAGARIAFNGSTGKQELGVIDRFQAGSQARLTEALKTNNWDAKATATNNHFDTFNDRFTAFDHNMKDAFHILLL